MGSPPVQSVLWKWENATHTKLLAHVSKKYIYYLISYGQICAWGNLRGLDSFNKKGHAELHRRAPTTSSSWVMLPIASRYALHVGHTSDQYTVGEPFMSFYTSSRSVRSLEQTAKGISNSHHDVGTVVTILGSFSLSGAGSSNSCADHPATPMKIIPFSYFPAKGRLVRPRASLLTPRGLNCDEHGGTTFFYSSALQNCKTHMSSQLDWEFRP